MNLLKWNSNGAMKKIVFMVAEKPSLAKALAELLSDGASCTSGSGVSCMHEYDGFFLSEHVRFKMTAVAGHLLALDFHAGFNNWDTTKPEELFEAATEKNDANPKLHLSNTLRQNARGADYLILWLDNDREGENICFEVIDCVKPVLKKCALQNIFRAKFSAITATDVKRAMQHLVEPNENESRAVDARQELDLRIGCAFTRFQTRYFQGKYGDLDSTLISCGPCQTPTVL